MQTKIIFGERLKRIREERGLTQKEVGKKTGIGNSRISSYERSVDEPDLEYIKTLANFYNINVDYLLGITDESASIKDMIGMDKVVICSEEERKLLKDYRHIPERSQNMVLKMLKLYIEDVKEKNKK